MNIKEQLEEFASRCREARNRGEDLPVWEGADLRDADLGGANLEGAKLWGADLRGANLRGANMEGANLGFADLRGADLGGANLWSADLQGADLEGADLRGAKLQGAKGVEDIPLEPIPGLAAKVLEQITKHPETWNQNGWHCETGHCCAGWAVVLAGEAGLAAEKRLGTPGAARLLLGGKSHPFHPSDSDRVIPWLEELAGGER